MIKRAKFTIRSYVRASLVIPIYTRWGVRTRARARARYFRFSCARSGAVGVVNKGGRTKGKKECDKEYWPRCLASPWTPSWQQAGGAGARCWLNPDVSYGYLLRATRRAFTHSHSRWYSVWSQLHTENTIPLYYSTVHRGTRADRSRATQLRFRAGPKTRRSARAPTRTTPSPRETERRTVIRWRHRWGRERKRERENAIRFDDVTPCFSQS